MRHRGSFFFFFYFTVFHHLQHSQPGSNSRHILPPKKTRNSRLVRQIWSHLEDDRGSRSAPEKAEQKSRSRWGNRESRRRWLWLTLASSSCSSSICSSSSSLLFLRSDLRRRKGISTPDETFSLIHGCTRSCVRTEPLQTVFESSSTRCFDFFFPHVRKQI